MLKCEKCIIWSRIYTFYINNCQNEQFNLDCFSKFKLTQINVIILFFRDPCGRLSRNWITIKKDQYEQMSRILSWSSTLNILFNYYKLD